MVRKCFTRAQHAVCQHMAIKAGSGDSSRNPTPRYIMRDKGETEAATVSAGPMRRRLSSAALLFAHWRVALATAVCALHASPAAATAWPVLTLRTNHKDVWWL